ncbi:MAG: HlyD family efflux transporter periplasmic adaptor subunit [Cyclobacteriaceae bacterium]|nr:HlyD family efflux transporter periplasmic adaptor subunit [Cyclobacteriaceae bacterium]
MDRIIEKKRWSVKKGATIVVIAAICLVLIYQFGFGDRRSKLNVDKSKITLATVKNDVFQEFIPQTGTVEPSVTFYLDAIEGGAIKKMHVESGAMLKKGEVIIELTNLNRELSVLSQEASLNESINRVRQTRLSLDQNDLKHQRTLADIDNALAKLTPRYQRDKILFESGAISKQNFEQTEADYNYNKRIRAITYTSYKKDSLSMANQIRQLNESEYRMIQSLNRVGRILDNLIIRAPFDGQLTAPRLFEGQAINPGQRLGQMDIVGSYKVRVPIDEHYLPRIDKGLKAKVKLAGVEYALFITYIYPDVVNGQFFVDMEFVDKAPDDIRRGLSLRLSIELSESSLQNIIPLGGFYNDTGGQWIFVLNEEGDKAQKRKIKIGRKNATHYEVENGLKVGEKVIVSSYDTFGDNEVLLLK